MIIETLTLTNFRQFRRKHTLRFSHGRKNVTVVLGENGRGKTGLFRALMFCLYGDRQLSQDGTKIDEHEVHLVNTAAEALQFVEEVGYDNVGILLDAYHMNIEESSPAAALRSAGAQLSLYHAADSNRQAIGRGHTDLWAQLAALDEIGYTGPIIMECTAPGPDPFTAIKDESSIGWLETYLEESRAWLLAGAR